MEWFSKNRYRLAATGFFVLSVVLRFLAADQSQHPAGWDGYYYVMQVHSWLTYGYLQSPDFSLIYPYFTAIAFITGDIILAYKAGVALLSGLLLVAMVHCLRDKPFPWVLVVCSYLLFSPLLTYFVLQFPKNFLGLIFLILFISSLPKKSPAAIFFIATIMTHRMTGGFALIVLAIFALKNIPWKWIATGGLVIILMSFLPGILHISDLARFNDQFTIIPHWAPYAFSQVFPKSLSILFKLELVLISLVILFSIYRSRSTIWLPIALISILPFFEFAAGSAGHRFFLVAPILFIMALPFEKLPIRFPLIPVSAFTFAALFAFKSYKPAYFDPPNKLYGNVVRNLDDRFEAREYPLVIAHKSLAEMIIFTTDFDALNWRPPQDMSATHVLRIINGVPYPYFRKYLDKSDLEQVKTLSKEYFAAPEDVWQRFVSNASKDDDKQVMARIFNGRNPMDQRPYFLEKGKR